MPTTILCFSLIRPKDKSAAAAAAAAAVATGLLLGVF